MEITLLTSFLMVSMALIIIPGPNVLVIVSTSIAHGKSQGLQTVAGTTSAMAIQLVVVAIGTTWLIQSLADGFQILKWLGVVYLLYLGLRHLKQALFNHGASTDKPSASSSFTKGFFVSLANPKTILFFSAFLPQFISSTGNYAQQIGILSCAFLFLAALFDSCYALLSAKLHPLLLQHDLFKIQNGICSLLYLGACVWLVSIRRVQ